MLGLCKWLSYPAAVWIVACVTLLSVSAHPAEAVLLECDLPAAYDAANTVAVATGVSEVATAITICPRCGLPDLENGRCRNCGLRFHKNLLPHVRNSPSPHEGSSPFPRVGSSPSSIRTDSRAITRSNQAIERNMRSLNESLRIMQRDITRIRTLNRRLP